MIHEALNLRRNIMMLFADRHSRPALRDELVREYPTMNLDTFILPWTECIQLPWKDSDDAMDFIYTHRRAAVEWDDGRQNPDGTTLEYRIDSELLEYMRHPENYFVTKKFTEALPWLAPFVNVEE